VPALPRLRVLLVKQPQASLADSWLPSPLAAVLAPSLDLATKREQGWPDLQEWANAFDFHKIVVEQPAPATVGGAQPAKAAQADASSATEDLEKRLQHGSRGREIVPLYAQPPATPRPGQIVAPKSLQELIDILQFPS
jgi:hypothetical protein